MSEHHRNLGLLASIIVAASMLAPSAIAASSGPPRLSSIEQHLLDLSNSARRLVGCGPLRPSATLSHAAAEHSADMAAHDYFAHVAPDGRDPADRAQNAGYLTGYVGENIAAGKKTAAFTFRQWMSSPGHRHNILDCSYTDLGVGYARSSDSRYQYYWTQMLGNPDIVAASQ